MMRYFREAFYELLARQSGQIHLLIVAPILTLFFLGLIVRSADSATNAAVEKKKVVAQLKKRLEEVQEAETLAAKEPPPSPPVSEEKHQVRKQETLTSILRTRGIDPNELERWVQATKGVRELKKLRPGNSLALRFDEERQRLQEVECEINSRTVLVMRDKGGSIEVHKEILPVTLEWKGVAGRIKSNLYNAAVGAGVPDKIISEMVDIFSSEIDFFSDLQPGDTFKVIYGEFARESRVVRVGHVLAAEIVNKGKAFTAFYADGQDERREYYDSQGRSIGGRFLKYPLEFTYISSVFEGSRFHPILKIKRPHLGVDFVAPVGTPVRAVADGKVAYAGYRRDSGNHVKIAHRSPYDSSYSHLKRIAEGIRVGTRVQVGQVIGYVGSTGLATSPHLHYALYKGKRYIDPLSFNHKLLVGQAGVANHKKQGHKNDRLNSSFAKIKEQLIKYLAAMKADSRPLVISLVIPKGFSTLPN